MTDIDIARHIRVVIADEYPMLREGTRQHLGREADVEVVGLADDGAGALALAAATHPDVLLLDTHLRDSSGILVALRLRQQFPKVKVIIMSGDDAGGGAGAWLSLGARGFLHKTASGDAIVAAVRSAAAGTTVVDSGEVRDALGGVREPLTLRETEVLGYVLAGASNAEIARKLDRSEKTVEGHLTHLFGKFGARSRAELIVRCHRLGLVGDLAVRN